MIGLNRLNFLYLINKNLLSLFILVVIASLLRPFPQISLMGLDETSYAFLIKHFADGTFLDDYIFTAFHPFYSFIASPLAMFGINPELAGRIVSYLFGVAAVIPAYFIGEKIFSKQAGFISGFMTATFPLLVKWSGIVQAQTVYSFMLLMSMLFVVLFYKNFKLIYAAFSGVFLSFAYLSRAEGIGIFAGNLLLFIVLWLKNKVEKKRILIGLSIFVISFLVVASPYVYALRLKTGDLKFTNKLYTQIRAAVIVSYNMDYEKYNYGKAEIPKEELLKMAIKIYPEKVFAAIKNFPEYYGYLPLFLAILPLFLMIFGFGTIALNKYLFFLPYLYVLLIIPFFFVVENYFAPYAPFVFVLAGCGVESLRMLSEKNLKKKSYLYIYGLILFLTAYNNVLHNKLKPYFVEKKQQFDIQGIIYTGYRDFGREVSHLIPINSKIMTRFNIGAWYAKGEYVSFPDVSWNEFLDVLDKQKVDYIMLGPAEMDMRTDLYNEIFWRIKGIIKDNKFKLVKRIVTPNYLEFYLIKVNK